MIVKVQRSIAGSTGVDTVLIYNQSRSHTETRLLTKSLERKLQGSYKRYFHAKMHEGCLVLGKTARAQDW